ncbi:MAG TPA: GNAT family N-acetyltransferase [Gaiellales bacterium]|nr:GNAT family N-acetyltransferase [Gaiellales bacterium]
MTGFVPDEFDPPHGLSAARFRLEPLGPQHNEADYAAWTSSMQHIRDTPGFATGSWPHEMTIDQNRDDLLGHQRDFDARTGFTYTVLDGEDDVIGCVYIYPLEPDPEPGAAHVESWVRADHAELDVPLYREVSDWLARDWPFRRVDYAARENP